MSSSPAAFSQLAYLYVQVPSSVRGLLISLKEALICVGVLSGYTAGYLCAEQARRCHDASTLQMYCNVDLLGVGRDLYRSVIWAVERLLNTNLDQSQVGGWRTIFGGAIFPAIGLGAGMVRTFANSGLPVL